MSVVQDVTQAFEATSDEEYARIFGMLSQACFELQQEVAEQQSDYAASNALPPDLHEPMASQVYLLKNLGNFARQQDRAHVKAFVNVEAYPLLLAKHGCQDSLAPAVAGDHLLMYRARQWKDTLVTHAHESTARCLIHINSIVRNMPERCSCSSHILRCKYKRCCCCRQCT